MQPGRRPPPGRIAQESSRTGVRFKKVVFETFTVTTRTLKTRI
jgi:hypothetical protein